MSGLTVQWTKIAILVFETGYEKFAGGVWTTLVDFLALNFERYRATCPISLYDSGYPAVTFAAFRKLKLRGFELVLLNSIIQITLLRIGDGDLKFRNNSMLGK